jgi:hypothetical protein
MVSGRSTTQFRLRAPPSEERPLMQEDETDRRALMKCPIGLKVTHSGHCESIVHRAGLHQQ